MSERPERLIVGGAYAVLGVVLVATRLVGIDRSLWHDEVVAVVDYIRRGPSEILAGANLSHELFSMLAWATTSLVGESEAVLRIWSVVPFVAGVAVVTIWLHRRFGALAGVLFLLLATASPLLLDISRQARGYGLAFCAMGVLVVGALEARRTPTSWALGAFFLAGVAGALTLPQFTIAFAATAVVLVLDKRLRRRAALGLALSLLAIGSWYAPHLGEVREASRIEDGTQIGTLELVVSPFHHVLIPSLLWIDGTVVVASVVWLPLVLLLAVVMAASPLLRDVWSAAALGAGVVATLVVLWIGDAYVIPRYLSFLLVPLFVVLATGMATTLGRLRDGRPQIVRTLACAAVLGMVCVAFATVVSDVMRYPREAPRDAAAIVERETSPSTPVLAYVRNPEGLDFYLDRPARDLRPEEVETAVCDSTVPVAYVTNPFGIPEVEVSCLERAGIRRFGARQYARGDEIVVWVVPPG